MLGVAYDAQEILEEPRLDLRGPLQHLVRSTLYSDDT